VPLALLVIFGALEIFTRTQLFNSSKDFRRFAGYAEKARHLEGSDGVRVVLMGNSATDRGVDLGVLQATFAASGARVSADLFVADQSRINTWQFMLQKYFFSPGLHPDWVVITFYEDDVQDGNPVEIGRLAQFFTSVGDWPAVFALDLPEWGQRVEFVVASGWATFAASERIRERALEALVPDFRSYSERANGAIYEHNQRRRRAPADAQAAPAPPTHRALRRLLRTAADHGVRLAFVAYPTRTDSGRPPYLVLPQTLEVLRDAGAPFLDLRHVPGLQGDEMYDDEVHLSEAGRIPYSRALATALAPLFVGDSRSPRAR
jgi:hypothetical protein